MYSVFDPMQGEKEEIIEAWRDHWKTFLGIGIFLILLGTGGLFTTIFTSLITIMLLGIFTFCAGVVKSIASFYALPSRQFFVQLLSGLLYIVVGIICLAKPIQALAALTLLIGALFTLNGIFKIAAFFFAKMALAGWVLISGILNLVLGAIVISAWPDTSLWVIGLFVALDLLMTGWTLVALSLIARKTE